MIVQHKQTREVEDVLFEAEIPEMPGWHVLTSSVDDDLRLIARHSEQAWTLGYSTRDQTLAPSAAVGGIPAIEVRRFLDMCDEFRAAWLAWRQSTEPQTVTLSLGPDGLRIEEP